MTDVTLQTFPNALAAALGIPVFAAGVLATILVIMGTVLPIMLLRKHEGWLIELVVGISDLGFSVAVGWTSYWLLLVVVMFVGGLWAAGFRDWITGRGAR